MMRPYHQFRDRFWEALPALPPGLSLTRIDSLVIPQTGPGGAAVFDTVMVKHLGRERPGLVAYRQRVLPGEAMGLGKRLRFAEGQLELRDGTRPLPRLRIIATETAGPGLIRVCDREGLGLLDLRGTVVLHAPDLLIRVEGTHTASREPRTPLFHGKACRVVRSLLNAPASVRTVRAIAQEIQSSYAYTFDVIHRLEKEGFVFRRSPRSGVVLRNPVGLLRAWIDSGERTALTVEPFNARSTTEHTLKQGLEELKARGAQGIFTLASALTPEEGFVTALPHGLYCAASTALVEEAFRLRRQTPHNFLVFRPEPAADTPHGGIQGSLRSLAPGPAVAVPQLIVDLSRQGGRAKEQAEALLGAWAHSLPIVGDE